jgi:hypothetical protein
MCVRDRDPDVQRLDGVQESVVAQAMVRQLSLSSNGGGADAMREVPGVVCCACFAPAFFSQPQPSPHWCESGLLGGTKEHRYCEQIMDRVIL